jgi:class 3 adenylate cyclase
MMRWLTTANPGWEARYGAPVQLAIGIHTGEAIVGNVGSEKRMEYTAIGDVVNVAARLEAIARPMQILVSAETRRRAGEAFEFGEIGERVLSGRQDPIHLYEVRS